MVVHKIAHVIVYKLVHILVHKIVHVIVYRVVHTFVHIGAQVKPTQLQVRATVTTLAA